jgi:beta-phosphoglucomutase-like phosphatase (HAD superfamily)
MRFHGAIFDVDGVLVDSPHERAWRESLQQLMAGPWQAIAPQTSYTPERYTTEVYQTYVAGKPREAGARAALDYFGIRDPDGQRLREYCATKQAYLLTLISQGQFVAFADALRFLLALKAAGVRIAAASSSKNANLFLAKIPIRKDSIPASAAGGAEPASADRTLLNLFDANVCGRDFARGKPDPMIFLAAAAELALPPAQCVVIEDAQSGVQAAKAGGMAAIGVARLGDQQLLAAAGADWVVTSLDELPLEQVIG